MLCDGAKTIFHFLKLACKQGLVLPREALPDRPTPTEILGRGPRWSGF
jgi:hypothetical protein